MQYSPLKVKDVWQEHVTFFFRVKEKAKLVTCFHSGFLSGFFFEPEDGGEMFLPIVGSYNTSGVWFINTV
jgi:hypothetical protein